MTSRVKNREQRKHRKTRNRMLLIVSVMVIAYTVLDIALAWVSSLRGNSFQFDSTLTSEVFGFAKWVVVSGASITVAKTFKGSTNSDETEPVADIPIPPEG